MRNLFLLVAAVVIAGFLAVWLIKMLFSLALYLVLGALVVGGAVYLYRRAKRSLTSVRMRQVRR